MAFPTAPFTPPESPGEPVFDGNEAVTQGPAATFCAGVVVGERINGHDSAGFKAFWENGNMTFTRFKAIRNNASGIWFDWDTLTPERPPPDACPPADRVRQSAIVNSIENQCSMNRGASK
jgi:hypothetical protein